MPAQSRAQRRRANTRQQPNAAPKNNPTPKVYDAPNTGETQVLAETMVDSSVEVPTIAMPTATATTATSASNSRVARRLRTRVAPEPVDYTKDYRDVAKDLRLITIWSVLLFAAMFGLYFARANGLF